MHIHESSTTRTWLQPSRKVGRLVTLLGALFFFGVGLCSLVMAPFTDMPWATGTLALFPFAIGYFLLLVTPEVELTPYAALAGAITLILASGGVWYAVTTTAKVQAAQLALERSVRIEAFVDQVIAQTASEAPNKAHLIRTVSALSDDQLCALHVLSPAHCRDLKRQETTTKDRQ